MTTEQNKPATVNTQLVTDLVSNNPLLLGAIDLPFVVIAATTLKNAAAFSIQMFCVHMVTIIVGWFVTSRLKIGQRVFVTTFVSTIMTLISRNLVLFIIPDIENFAGIYLYLIAVNGVTLAQANFQKKDSKLRDVVRSGLLNVLVFFLIMTFVAFVREYLGSGTLWGVRMPLLFKLEGIRSPFFGFIIFAFLLAVGRFAAKKFTQFKLLEPTNSKEL